MNYAYENMQSVLCANAECQKELSAEYCDTAVWVPGPYKLGHRGDTGIAFAFCIDCGERAREGNWPAIHIRATAASCRLTTFIDSIL